MPPFHINTASVDFHSNKRWWGLRNDTRKQSRARSFTSWTKRWHNIKIKFWFIRYRINKNQCRRLFITIVPLPPYKSTVSKLVLNYPTTSNWELGRKKNGFWYLHTKSCTFQPLEWCKICIKNHRIAKSAPYSYWIRVIYWALTYSNTS